MWATAILKMVSLSGFLARALQVGTISESSVMYADILFLLLRSISQWFSLANLSLSGPIPPSSSRRPYFCPVGSSSSSLLLGIMVWAVGTGMAIAMLLDVQVHHLHLQLQQLLTQPPLLVLRSTLFYHLAILVRICLGPGSGDPKVAIFNPLTLALFNFFYFFSPLFPSAAPTAAPAATRAAQLQQRDSHWSSRFSCRSESS